MQIVSVVSESNYTISIPGHTYPGMTPDSMVVEVSTDCGNLVATTWQLEIYGYDCSGFLDEYNMNWAAVNWCHPEAANPQFFPLPQLDINGDGNFGDAYTVKVTNEGVFLWENNMLGDSIAPYRSGYSYLQENDLADISTDDLVVVHGNVYNDQNANCTLDNQEAGLDNFLIEVNNVTQGIITVVATDNLGNYSADFCNNQDTIIVKALVPFNSGGSCVTTQTIILDGVADSTEVNLAVQIECPTIAVDIGTPRLRRCFDNIYNVNIQNYNFNNVDDVYIEIELDSFMQMVSSTLPSTDLGNNIYRFDIGTLEALEFDFFQFTINLSCDATLGQSHCVKASAFPVISCFVDPNWSGASIQLSAACIGDSIEVKIENVGSNDMSQSSNYIIVEDVVMMFSNPFQLNVGASEILHLPANGSTWHVTAMQEPLHPSLGDPAITIEGCGGLGNPGALLSFPQGDSDPYVSIDCQQNIGSYDPNDKQVFPAGLGANKAILPDLDLEYLIRFQNTGTDTAFTVVLIDTLSEYLNNDQIIPGVSSHEYTFERLENNILKFTFSNILLPDSTTDLTGSQGFLKYKIPQKEANNPGTIIHSETAIYFDFNEPVITNDAFVTIQDHPYGEVTWTETPNPIAIDLEVFPNPFTESTQLHIKDPNFVEGILNIYNANGQLLQQQTITSPQTSLNFTNWTKGLYFIKLQSDGQIIAVGKLLLK